MSQYTVPFYLHHDRSVPTCAHLPAFNGLACCSPSCLRVPYARLQWFYAGLPRLFACGVSAYFVSWSLASVVPACAVYAFMWSVCCLLLCVPIFWFSSCLAKQIPYSCRKEKLCGAPCQGWKSMCVCQCKDQMHRRIECSWLWGRKSISQHHLKFQRWWMLLTVPWSFLDMDIRRKKKCIDMILCARMRLLIATLCRNIS